MNFGFQLKFSFQDQSDEIHARQHNNFSLPSRLTLRSHKSVLIEVVALYGASGVFDRFHCSTHQCERARVSSTRCFRSGVENLIRNIKSASSFRVNVDKNEKVVRCSRESWLLLNISVK